MLPAGCYDGDVMDRLALEACKQMGSFTTGQDLSCLVSAWSHPHAAVTLVHLWVACLTDGGHARIVGCG